MMIATGQPSAYFPLKINRSQSKEGNSVVPIKFPSTRNVLWQSKPVGDFETLALILDKNVVQLFIVEKSLRLAHRYAEDRRLTSFLLGSVYPKSGDSGVCFGVDRFDPGREITEKIGENVTKSKVPTAVVPGDHIIPIIVKQELLTSDDSISHTKEEFARAVQVMEAKICGKELLTLSHVVSLKANLYCCRKQDELIISLHCGAIVPDLKFQARPIAPLSIIPTTLARNLAGPLRLSDVEGTPKMGYVTMDETRKLLLLLELDPKLYDLPLIGIWISGVHNVHHPYVWASCLRYLNCREIKDRVLHPSGSFLLLHFSIVQKIPDFWECFLDNDEKLDFELLSCQEDLHLDLDDCSSKEPLCFHLTRSPSGMNKTLFDEAIAEWKKDRNSLKTIEQDVDVNQKNSYSKLSGLRNDDNPRPSTSRHPSPTTQGTPNAPAPEESLSLSFDEGSNNFDKNHSQRTLENPKNRAPRFKRSLNPAKPVPNNSDSFKISRQPFKQITPQDQHNSPNSSQNRGKPVLSSRNQVNRKEENKENTPLTSRYVPKGNITRKPPSKSTDENNFPFCYEKSKNNPRSQSVGNEQQNTLSDLNSSNPSLPLTHFGNRKRHHSEGVQSCQVRQPNDLHQRSSNSSLALSDDDNLSHISLDSSFTNNHEPRRLTNQSPAIRNPPHSPERFPNNCQYLPMARSSKHSGRLMDQPLKSDSCKLNDQSSRSDVNSRIQSKAESRQNSPKVCGNVGQTSPRSDNQQRALATSDKPAQQNLNYMNFQSTNPDINQCKRITSDDKKRRSFAGKSPQPCNRDNIQRPLSDNRHPSPKNTDDGTSAVYHRVNPLQGESSLTSYTSNDMPEESKDIVTYQPSDISPQHQTKSGDMTNQRVDIDSQASGRKYGDIVEAAESNFSDTMQRSPDTCSYMKPNSHSSTKHSNQMFSAKRRNSATGFPSVPHITEFDPNAELANSSSKTAIVEVHCVANEQQKKVQQLSSNQELEEQVRRQEGMIKILQEQVRSLLKIKEEVSSESLSLPLTPASTPVSTSENGERLSHRSSPDRQENASQIVQRKHEAERVTIGVNTGASLLWEKPQDSCEKCCECKRPQTEHIQQDAEDNTEPSKHPDVFPTPEKTESLISLSQVDVPTDSADSLTPAISNMIIPCMSVNDDSLLSNQAAVTSERKEESAGGNEVTVKGREFYDKLLGQVKDLLSEQVSTKQQVSKEEVQHTSESDHAPTREIVVKATLKQLEKIKHAEQDRRQQSFTRLQTETSSVFSTHQRSLSTSFLPEHPRLNYVSMSVDDTFDEVTYIDEVALKYLSDEELKQFKSELRPSSGSAVKRSFTRTVRFGSFPSDNERRSLSRRNIREVDFTWNNLSFCTKNYLAKYNLVEGQVSLHAQEEVDTPCKDDSPETSIEPCKPPFPSPAPEGSSHILDIKRLKNLPKLF